MKWLMHKFDATIAAMQKKRKADMHLTHTQRVRQKELVSRLWSWSIRSAGENAHEEALGRRLCCRFYRILDVWFHRTVRRNGGQSDARDHFRAVPSGTRGRIDGLGAGHATCPPHEWTTRGGAGTAGRGTLGRSRLTFDARGGARDNGYVNSYGCGHTAANLSHHGQGAFDASREPLDAFGAVFSAVSERLPRTGQSVTLQFYLHKINHLQPVCCAMQRRFASWVGASPFDQPSLKGSRDVLS